MSEQLKNELEPTFRQVLTEAQEFKKNHPNEPIPVTPIQGQTLPDPQPGPAPKKRGYHHPQPSFAGQKRARINESRDFPTYHVHLSDHHPIKSDDILMWNLTQRCRKDNNGFGCNNFSSIVYEFWFKK